MIPVKNSCHARDIDAVWSATAAVDADIDRFEDVAVAIIFIVPDRIVRVVVTLDTANCQTEKCLRRVFDRVPNPLFATVGVPVPNEETGGSQVAGVKWHDLVAGQHLHDHLLVTFVGIQRFDDPISPVPDVLLAKADFAAMSVPIAVTPNVQPVSPPPLAVMRTGQQTIDRVFVGTRRLVSQKCLQLFSSRWQPDQVQVGASEQHVPWRQWPSHDLCLLLLPQDERVNRIP